MKRRLLLLGFILTLLTPVAAALYTPGQAAAVSGVGNNVLELVGEHCHDLNDITHDFSGIDSHNGYGSRCHNRDDSDNPLQGSVEPGWEEALQDTLGCSDSMFYKHDFKDPNDSSVTTKTLWYTHLGAYKECYNKAQAMFSNLTNPNGDCKLAVEGSDNYTACATDVKNLYIALGCSSSDMFKKTGKQNSQGDNYWAVDSGSAALKDCQNRINDVGNVRIVVFDGSGHTTKSPQIKSPSVTADTTDGDGSGEGSNVPSVNCNVSFNPLTWVICPAVQGMVSIVGDLDNAINSALSVGTAGNSDDPNQIFCNSDTAAADVNNCEAYHSAWSSFRNIALGLLAVVGLVIIISEMAGLELLDAYTLRKVLPRLIFAAIAITLSWQLMQFLVTFTNDLGYGVRYLIYQPFVRAGIDSVTLNGGGLVAANLIAAGGIVALGVFGLLSFAATAALAVAVAFLTLVIRQLLIIILIIIAPVAILTYVLPNTQRAYKLWWDSLSKALLMFPLIAAFIATGRVFSAVASNGASDNVFLQLIGFVAYFAPYFMIPLTFRFAGGALATLGGFVNDRQRGMFDRLKNYRGNKAQTNMQALAAGNRYKASNPAAKAFNRTTRGIANIPSAGVMPHKWRSRYQSGLSQQKMTAMNEYMEKSEAFKAMSGNDDYLQATMKNMGGGDTEREWRQYLSSHGYKGRALEQGVAAIRAAKRDTNDEIFKASAVVANASTGTGWKDGGAGEMMQSINEAAGNDRDLAARMLADTRNRATQARRTDLAGAGFGGQMGALNAMHSAEYNLDDQGNSLGRKMTTAEASDKMHDAALYLQGPGALVGARGDTIKLLAPQMVKRLNNAHQAYSNAGTPQEKAAAERQLKQEYAVLAGRYDAMSQASPENAQIMADTVLGAGVAGKSVQERIEQFRDDQQFLEMRREYGNQATAAAAAQQAAAAQPQGPQGPQGPQPQGPQGP